MKTGKWDKLIQLVTGSYAPFLIYSAVFIALIIFLMSTIKVDSYKVYECTADDSCETVVFSEDISLEDADYLYIYVNKSDEIVKVDKEDVHLENGTALSFLDDEAKAFVKRNGITKYYVEVPVKSSIWKSMFASII